MARKSAEEKAKEHGWVRLNRGEIIKWHKNKIVEGIYLGMKTGKFNSPLLRISNENGETEIYSCPTVLASFLEGVKTGFRVKIVCLGQTIDTEKGQKAFDFEVYYHGEKS